MPAKACPFCGKIPEEVVPNKGPWVGFKRAFHRCKYIGYIDVAEWIEGEINYSRWNTRADIKELDSQQPTTEKKTRRIKK